MKQAFDHVVLSLPDVNDFQKFLYVDATVVATGDELLECWDTRNRFARCCVGGSSGSRPLCCHLDKESWSRWLAHELKNRFGVPGVRELPRYWAEPDDYSVGVRSESNVHERQFRIWPSRFQTPASGQQGDRYTIGVWQSLASEPSATTMVSTVSPQA